MLEIINKKIIYPAYLKWNGDDRLKKLSEYEKIQWASTDELMDNQFKAFLSIIKYANIHVPYYRRLFKASQIHPDDIKYPDDISKIPSLTKKDLQNNLSDLISEACPPSQRFENASGGSTGQPTIFYGDYKCLTSKFAALMMSDMWTGWDIGEKSAYLWGADREVNKVSNFKEQFVQKHIYRRNMLNAFCMDDKDMFAFANNLLKSKPKLMVAYANAIHRFAQFVNNNGITGLSFKGIVSSAETLFEDKRKFIENVFNCKVLNRYGSREVALIASECQCQQGLHINTTGVYVEFIPVLAENANGLNEVVVTDLENHVMPLIRYNTGDTSQPLNKKCDCGRGLPLMGNVTGRTSDFIVHPNGKLIHGEFFSHIFYGIQGIVQFQIHQQSINSIKIKLVANNHFDSNDKDVIKNKIIDILDNSIDINIEDVDEIPTPPSGKYRFAISSVN